VRILFLLILMLCPASAHDSWISSGAYRNSANEWCCGEGDCFVVHAQGVSLPAPGYRIVETGEFVPFSEAQISMDGRYWRCKRPDGSRRCFFAPPPAM
jgi:hypothetical protein